jgi:hypothetical protein
VTPADIVWKDYSIAWDVSRDRYGRLLIYRRRFDMGASHEPYTEPYCVWLYDTFTPTTSFHVNFKVYPSVNDLMLQCMFNYYGGNDAEEGTTQAPQQGSARTHDAQIASDT